MTLRSVSFAAAVVAALAVGGCTSEAPPPQVATAARPTASTGPGGANPSTSPESDYDKALRFTRCMNALGEHIPDPVEGQPLQLAGMPDLSQIGPNNNWTAVVPSANFAKCKQYLPSSWPVKEDPKQLAKEAKFSDCMTRHGIAVPQPDAQGMVHYSTDPGFWETPEYRAAESACRYLYDDPANNNQQ
jgi:hypothetical protein